MGRRRVGGRNCRARAACWMARGPTAPRTHSPWKRMWPDAHAARLLEAALVGYVGGADCGQRREACAYCLRDLALGLMVTTIYAAAVAALERIVRLYGHEGPVAAPARRASV
eukprot:scaffold4482_cov393-Prasinococcus_capsulatus_cf.AAC.17